MKTRHYIVAIILIPAFLLIRFISDFGDDNQDNYLVTKVIDGDTFELEKRGKVRMLGIDSPEEGEPFHDPAKSFLSSLILNKRVGLTHDFRKRDGYGRLLAYVFVDTVLINGEILRNGLANVYFFPDNYSNDKMYFRLLAAQNKAIDESAGIWSLPFIEEEFYVGNSRTTRFHRPMCKAAARLSKNGKVLFTKREEPFINGYSPCRNCKP